MTYILLGWSDFGLFWWCFKTKKLITSTANLHFTYCTLYNSIKRQSFHSPKIIWPFKKLLFFENLQRTIIEEQIWNRNFLDMFHVPVFLYKLWKQNKNLASLHFYLLKNPRICSLCYWLKQLIFVCSCCWFQGNIQNFLGSRDKLISKI